MVNPTRRLTRAARNALNKLVWRELGVLCVAAWREAQRTAQPPSPEPGAFAGAWRVPGLWPDKPKDEEP